MLTRESKCDSTSVETTEGVGGVNDNVDGSPNFFEETTPTKLPGVKRQIDEVEGMSSVEKKIKKHVDKWIDDVLVQPKNYYKPYRNISMRRRFDRVDEIAKNVVAACVSRENLEKGRTSYLRNDVDLRTDVLMILEEVKIKLAKEMKCNFAAVENEVTPSPDEIQALEEEV